MNDINKQEKATSSSTQPNPMKQPNPPKMPTQEQRGGGDWKPITGGKPNDR